MVPEATIFAIIGEKEPSFVPFLQYLQRQTAIEFDSGVTLRTLSGEISMTTLMSLATSERRFEP
jgi:hypothetical protein